MKFFIILTLPPTSLFETHTIPLTVTAMTTSYLDSRNLYRNNMATAEAASDRRDRPARVTRSSAAKLASSQPAQTTRVTRSSAAAARARSTTSSVPQPVATQATTSSATKTSVDTSTTKKRKTTATIDNERSAQKPEPETIELITFNISPEPTVVKRKSLPFVKGRRVAYGYVINTNWLEQKARKLLDLKGRRIRWRVCDTFENMETYVLNLLWDAGMKCARNQLMGSDGYGPTFGIYWKSNFDPKCVCPSQPCLVLHIDMY
ncbi:hypothetical protein C8Q75DRAFT_746047 [Abortiporus biennis]|nr:hypothetical protein C8Q75DRAFT_746047 [Abortiporus biennis]